MRFDLVGIKNTADHGEDPSEDGLEDRLALNDSFTSSEVKIRLLVDNIVSPINLISMSLDCRRTSEHPE